MTSYDDPNREAVGLSPIWTGAGEEPEGDGETTSTSGSFDPGEHTVGEVEAYIAEHPNERATVLQAEAVGKNRSSLVGSVE